MLNTTPAALELIDLWGEYALTPTLRLRAGQFKQPFTAYRMRSFTELAFVDWAIVTRPFGGERQLGVELHDRGALRADARARADRLVGAAAADQQAGTQRRYADAGRVGFEQELTAGASVRLVGVWLSAQADFGWLGTARDAGDRDELRGRAQVQVAF